MRDGVQADPGRLAKALHLHPITAKLLINRGYEDPERARAFLHPLEEALFPPDQMRDMDRAVAKLREASALGQRILVYGDYDADGLCATAILADALREVGVEALTYIPVSYTHLDVYKRQVAPTLLGLLGLPIPAGMQGRNLAPLLQQGEEEGLPAERNAYFECVLGEVGIHTTCLLYTSRCV